MQQGGGQIMELSSKSNSSDEQTHPEIGENISALHILRPQLDLAEGLVLILLQISQ
jgi:hypothetical protein